MATVTFPRLLAACALAASMIAPLAQAERLKDLASIAGVRQNQLMGYGLVVGLDGSGDQTTQTPFTIQSVAAMLQQQGINLPQGSSLQLKNVAAVMVTTSLPAFAQPGQMLDVTVSSMGNAKSLRGGTLLMTPLKGADGQVYGMAQGNVLVGGVGAQAAGSSIVINHLSVGRISGGATVERTVPSVLGANNTIRLELNATDFATASRVVDAINSRYGAGTADWRRVEIPSANGHATAPALARLMGALASGGSLDGVAVLSPAALELARAERIIGRDLVLPFDISWGAGFMRNTPNFFYGPAPDAFGHSGWGGSCAFADPARGVSGAYVMNRQGSDLIGDPRAVRLIQAAYSCL